MATYQKRALQLFGGLVVTCSGDACPNVVECQLTKAAASILQYTGTPVQDCDAINDANCLAALAFQAQILGSIGFEQADRLSAIERILNSECVCEYEMWEVENARAVISFCRRSDPESSFRGIMQRCLAILEKEPNDVFSLRLAFISAFMSGEYALLYRILRHVLASSSVFCTNEAEPLLVNALLHPLSIATSSNSCEEKMTAVWLGSKLLLPFLATYFAFSLEELAMDPISERVGTEDSDLSDPGCALPSSELLDGCQRWNEFGLESLQWLNTLLVASEPTDEKPFSRLLRSQLRTSFANGLAHPFAMHTICHLYEARRDPAGGLAAIDERVPPSLWQDTTHLVMHCWWHLALFNFDIGNTAVAVQMYDEKVIPAIAKEDPFAVSDASALILRLIFDDKLKRSDERVTVLHQWWMYHEGDPYRRAMIRTVPFFELHSVMIQWAAQCVAQRLPQPARGSQVVALVARVCEANLAKQGETVLSELWNSRAVWWEVGGSAAQRDLIYRFCLHLALLPQVDGSAADEGEASVSTTARANTLACTRNSILEVVRHITDVYPKQGYYRRIVEKEKKNH